MEPGQRYADKLVVIVGPTASGKSEAAMRVARTHGGEIICADSRTVYRGLDVGTAKPSLEDQREVRHHLLDVVEPDEVFSAAQFQHLANAAIKDINSRGKLPVMVGGTGLFVDGVLFDYEFGDVPDAVLRVQLEDKAVEELQKYCIENDIAMPVSISNKRHLIRAIEQKGINRNKSTHMREDAYVIGISPEREVLQKRIRNRAKQLFGGNVVEEATIAAEKYGWDAPGLSGNIYPIIRRMVAGEVTEAEATELFIKADWQLARRQMTWFRRNPGIIWCDSSDEAARLIDAQIAV